MPRSMVVVSSGEMRQGSSPGKMPTNSQISGDGRTGGRQQDGFQGGRVAKRPRPWGGQHLLAGGLAAVAVLKVAAWWPRWRAG